MGRHYLKNLEIADSGSDVIVTGYDYLGDEFKGVFPRESIRDGGLEVEVTGGFKKNGGIFMTIKPMNGSFENRSYGISVRDSELRIADS